MKDITQIFYIHSNITYLAALSIIQEKKFNEPLLLFGRAYRNDFLQNDYQKIYLDKTIDSLNSIPSYGRRWLVIKYAGPLNQIKTLLSKYGSAGYVCYLPHIKNYLMQYIVMNKRCKSFSIMDEGLLSYTNPKIFLKQNHKRYQQTYLSKIRSLLKYVNHANASSAYFPIKARLDRIYLFYEDLKRVWEGVNVSIMKWPIIDANLPDFSNKRIYILDNLDNNTFLDPENIPKILHGIFKQFKNCELYVKCHPANRNIEEIIRILKSAEVNYKVINPNVPLELVFMQSKNIKVYGLFSSLLFYASIFGHDSISYAKYAEPYDPMIKNMMGNYMPRIFFEKVKIVDILSSNMRE